MTQVCEKIFVNTLQLNCLSTCSPEKRLQVSARNIIGTIRRANLITRPYVLCHDVYIFEILGNSHRANKLNKMKVITDTVNAVFLNPSNVSKQFSLTSRNDVINIFDKEKHSEHCL